ncbi:putative pterin-4-alpha-carbinolamine dehydratase [Leptospira ryugenii]|uniref:4a-hydroxytetrahydrobiopterin dehydratase n=1 Tax=Leptospira ryugenii TaxID=1917863 RepID=A0A2P2DVI5_9LEPT|nr:4a-hydroxytetrahydrobiopterin dehydratase [Leptospira ryugenii]GBF48659.1 putative pterin-4-alpha-carbinolamine dehydratase [Leptospira ryugenii]
MSEWFYQESQTESFLEREFVFANFLEAFAFMTKVAILSEKNDHHPDWRNVWNKVYIKLSTHEANNTVTDKDRNLAEEIDRIL